MDDDNKLLERICQASETTAYRSGWLLFFVGLAVLGRLVGSLVAMVP